VKKKEESQQEIENRNKKNQVKQRWITRKKWRKTEKRRSSNLKS